MRNVLARLSFVFLMPSCNASSLVRRSPSFTNFPARRTSRRNACCNFLRTELLRGLEGLLLFGGGDRGLPLLLVLRRLFWLLSRLLMLRLIDLLLDVLLVLGLLLDRLSLVLLLSSDSDVLLVLGLLLLDVLVLLIRLRNRRLLKRLDDTGILFPPLLLMLALFSFPVGVLCISRLKLPVSSATGSLIIGLTTGSSSSPSLVALTMSIGPACLTFWLDVL